MFYKNIKQANSKSPNRFIANTEIEAKLKFVMLKHRSVWAINTNATMFVQELWW